MRRRRPISRLQQCCSARANAVAAGTPSAAGNIQVSGVAEAGPKGVVILSVDGKPGAAYGVNDDVTEGTDGEIGCAGQGRARSARQADRAEDADACIARRALERRRQAARAVGHAAPRAGSTRTMAPPRRRAAAAARSRSSSRRSRRNSSRSSSSSSSSSRQQLQQQQLQQQQLQQQQIQQQQMQQQPATASRPASRRPAAARADVPGLGGRCNPARRRARSTAVSGQRQVPDQEPMPGQGNRRRAAVAPGQQLPGRSSSGGSSPAGRDRRRQHGLPHGSPAGPRSGGNRTLIRATAVHAAGG